MVLESIQRQTETGKRCGKGEKTKEREKKDTVGDEQRKKNRVQSIERGRGLKRESKDKQGQLESDVNVKPPVILQGTNVLLVVRLLKCQFSVWILIPTHCKLLLL